MKPSRLSFLSATAACQAALRPFLPWRQCTLSPFDGCHHLVYHTALEFMSLDLSPHPYRCENLTSQAVFYIIWTLAGRRFAPLGMIGKPTLQQGLGPKAKAPESRERHSVALPPSARKRSRGPPSPSMSPEDAPCRLRPNRRCFLQLLSPFPAPLLPVSRPTCGRSSTQAGAEVKAPLGKTEAKSSASRIPKGGAE